MFKYPETFKKAYPSSLREEIDIIISTVSVDENYEYEPTEPFEVYVCGELVKIPERIYYGQKIKCKNALSELQFDILNCYFTRHHNGRIREKYLRNIILLNKSWVVPYVMRLIGEYVIEILQVIYENIDELNISIYCDFIENNNVFYEKTKRRVTSYWSCYYRNLYKNKQDYVGFKILQVLDNEYYKTKKL